MRKCGSHFPVLGPRNPYATYLDYASLRQNSTPDMRYSQRRQRPSVVPYWNPNSRSSIITLVMP